MPRKLQYLVCLLTFTCLIAKESKAQYYYNDRNLSFGLSFSPNYGWLKLEDDSYDQEARFGYSYGLIADFGFTRNYFFSTGLQINTVNSRLIDNRGQSNKDLKIQYAEVPLAIKLKTEGNDLGKFYGLFGFTAGFKVSAKEKEINDSNYVKMSGADLIRLGLQIGAGAEWRVGYNHAFVTGLTFNNGFTRAIKSGAAKNSYVSLNLSFLF